jgi:ATP-dependent Clp protease adaptor protein ClpS
LNISEQSSNIRVRTPVESDLFRFIFSLELMPSETRSMASENQGDVVLEAEKSKLKPPPMFKVILLNDDYTPMDFVVIVLQNFFSMNREQATQIMLKVHMDGAGICGVFPNDVASTKVAQVVTFARQHQHPLQCVMEET